MGFNGLWFQCLVALKPINQKCLISMVFVSPRTNSDTKGSLCPSSVRLSVRLSHSHSYVSQATHAFRGMLPLFWYAICNHNFSTSKIIFFKKFAREWNSYLYGVFSIIKYTTLLNRLTEFDIAIVYPDTFISKALAIETNWYGLLDDF